MATQLRPFLTDIANAIRSKKGTSGVINAQNFASEIASIPTGGEENPIQTLVSGRGAYGGHYLCYFYTGDNVDFLNGIDFSAVTNMKSMFHNATNITAIPSINTSNAAIMEDVFRSCSSLISIPSLDTSKATSISGLVRGCSSLISIPSLDTSKATSMSSTFYACFRLTTIDITKLVSSAYECFYACHSLTKLIIRTMDTIPAFGNRMFEGCYHFLGTSFGEWNPDKLKDGRIYVPDAQVDNLKAATGWADFADIIVPLSTLVE